MSDNGDKRVDQPTGTEFVGHEWDGIEELDTPLPRWWLIIFYGTVIWAVIYDTEYAMVDKDDDIKLALKSTAIIFGKFSRLIIGVLQFFFLGGLTLLGESHEFGLIYQLSIFSAGLCFLYQHLLLSKATRENYFKAFLNNHWVGFFIFVGICGNFL